MTHDESDGPIQYSSPAAIERFERTSANSIPGREPALRMAAALLAARVPEGGSILSVGTGTGLDLSLLASIRRDWTLTGVDPAAPMIDAARNRLANDGFSGRCTLLVGTADVLPAEPVFDGASCIMVLPVLPDNGAKGALLAAIAARLKPGARLVFTSPYTLNEQAEMGSAWRWYARGMGETDADIEVLAAQVRREIHFTSEERLMELAAEAGFQPPQRFYQALWFGGWFAEKQ